MNTKETKPPNLEEGLKAPAGEDNTSGPFSEEPTEQPETPSASNSKPEEGFMRQMKVLGIISKASMKTTIKNDEVQKELVFQVRVSGNGARMANIELLENEFLEEVVQIDITSFQQDLTKDIRFK